VGGPNSDASYLDRRYTGRLKKRDNSLTGEGRGRSRIIRLQKSLALYKSFNTLCIPFRGGVGIVLNGQFLLPGQNLVAPDPVLVVQGEAENRELSKTEKDSYSSFQYSI
jgi:hypothetical protein